MKEDVKVIENQTLKQIVEGTVKSWKSADELGEFIFDLNSMIIDKKLTITQGVSGVIGWILLMAENEEQDEKLISH